MKKISTIFKNILNHNKFKIKGQIYIYPLVSSIPDDVMTLDNFIPLPLPLQRMKILY